ncbi:unnamed protein product [Prorocentrum cordatum]|uniref:Uncharacterized protein n=1 Tax=Prorocentrum cordatum TaxID=2364126 RepID=A0ABN9UJP1_9DINO|nr:unnamed protein product [Polarella glacialis]
MPKDIDGDNEAEVLVRGDAGGAQQTGRTPGSPALAGDRVFPATPGIQRRGSGCALESTVDVSAAWPGPRSWNDSCEASSLSSIVDCIQPLLFEIAGFLTESPRDLAPLCAMSASFVSAQIRPVANSLWSDVYRRRWPTFHECLDFQGPQDWRSVYPQRRLAAAPRGCASRARLAGAPRARGSADVETLSGRLECTLEVFEREKKLGRLGGSTAAHRHRCFAEARWDADWAGLRAGGCAGAARGLAARGPESPAPSRQKLPRFAMAAMPARLQYETSLGAYLARYLSASQVPPEPIPPHEEHRLRFCPRGVRGRLRCGPPSEGGDAKTEATAPTESLKDPHGCDLSRYPYRVLGGLEGLEVGRSVELQWKMQEGSPFGWWYGRLDALAVKPDGLAQATITFNHFPVNSRWYRLDVVIGDTRVRDCSFGGYTGGIRPVSEDEDRQCMKFFPKEPVVF